MREIRTLTSDAFAPEKLATMAALGADLTIVPSVGGKITPDLTPRMIETARELAADPNVDWTDQLHNTDSLVGYHQVGVELLEQMAQPIDVFCCAVGTAGMATGVRNAFEEAGCSARLVIFEPDSSPVISTGRSGTNSVEGIGIGMVPPLLDPGGRRVRDGPSPRRRRGPARRRIHGARRDRAVQLAREIGPGKTVVTVACDTGLKYLTGELFRRNGSAGDVAGSTHDPSSSEGA